MSQNLHTDLPLAARQIFNHLVDFYDIEENATRHSKMPSHAYLAAEKTARLVNEAVDALPKHERPSLEGLQTLSRSAYRIGLAAGQELARSESAIKQYAELALTGNDDALVAFKKATFASPDGTKMMSGGDLLREAGLSPTEAPRLFAPDSEGHGKGFVDNLDTSDKGGRGRGGHSGGKKKSA